MSRHRNVRNRAYSYEYDGTLESDTKMRNPHIDLLICAEYDEDYEDDTPHSPSTGNVIFCTRRFMFYTL